MCSRIVAADHHIRGECDAVGDGPDDVGSVSGHGHPAGINIRLFNLMHKTVDLFAESPIHGNAVKRAVVILCHDKTAFGLAAPVATGGDDAQVRIGIRQIGIDACDVAVAFRIGKGIAAFLIHIPESKAAQISQNIHQLHFAGHRCINI